jgi:hypothetical protein
MSEPKWHKQGRQMGPFRSAWTWIRAWIRGGGSPYPRGKSLVVHLSEEQYAQVERAAWHWALMTEDWAVGVLVTVAAQQLLERPEGIHDQADDPPDHPPEALQ